MIDVRRNPGGRLRGSLFSVFSVSSVVKTLRFLLSAIRVARGNRIITDSPLVLTKLGWDI